MKLIEEIREMDDSSLIQLHNDYCEANRLHDVIYNNDEEFFNTFCKTPYEALELTRKGGYKHLDKYVLFDAYGFIESLTDLQSTLEFEEIAEWVENNEYHEKYNLTKEEESEF